MSTDYADLQTRVDKAFGRMAEYGFTLRAEKCVSQDDRITNTQIGLPFLMLVKSCYKRPKENECGSYKS